MSIDWIIPWIVDALPIGWEWMGRPIVGAMLLSPLVAAIFVVWVTWKAVAEWKNDDHRP